MYLSNIQNGPWLLIVLISTWSYNVVDVVHILLLSTVLDNVRGLLYSPTFFRSSYRFLLDLTIPDITLLYSLYPFNL